MCKEKVLKVAFYIKGHRCLVECSNRLNKTPQYNGTHRVVSEGLNRGRHVLDCTCGHRHVTTYNNGQVTIVSRWDKTRSVT